MQRDSIDFANQPIGRLFCKMFVPILVGMISMVVLNITDGAFVGHGAGSDALAAVNIVAPIYLFSGALGLMFGVGGSVVASIHLAKGNTKAACINMTQATIAGVTLGGIICLLLFCFQEESCRLFGCSESLMALACNYLKWVAWLIPFNIFGMVTMFMIRLDGSPKTAMAINLAVAITNMILDYVLIFPFGMGIEGAAIATTISFTIGNIPISIYLLRYAKTLRFYPLKWSRKSFILSMRNIIYQAKLGFSSFLSEIAIASVIVLGNFIFMDYLQEDGVAAYSVCCYCLPVVFMMGSAILQSVQPIISFAYGVGNKHRMYQALRLAIVTAVGISIVSTSIMWIFGDIVSATFINRTDNAFQLCHQGLPLFALGYVFVSLNIVMVGYYQSIENHKTATLFTSLRGFIFVIPCFIILPMIWNPEGLWFALPLAEAITLVVIILHTIIARQRDK